MVLAEFLCEKEKALDSLRLLRPGLEPDEIDPGIYELLMDLNKLDFLYTMSSCSGMPEDHGGKYQRLVPARIENRGYQGWITMEVDPTDLRLQRFKFNLNLIDRIGFYKIPGGETFRILQAFVPETFLDDPTYLISVWGEISDIVRGFK